MRYFKPQLQLIRPLAQAIATVALLAACATEPPPIGPTLSDMEPVTIPTNHMPVPQVPLAQIEDSYRAALEVAQDPVIRHRILARLADMEMARSQERQLTATEQKQFFGEAIALYQELIASSDTLVEQQEASPGDSDTSPDHASLDKERLLYQLSKAYALDGRLQESTAVLEKLVRQYPDSPYAAEADFRRAEIAFSAGDYRRAEELYNQVLSVGQTPFYSNAVYMHGWSLFKQNRYRPALESFSRVLDDQLVEGIPLEQLAISRQNLVADTLRIMAVAFSYLSGPDTIAELYQNRGEPHYQYLLYRQLGDLYLDKKRYRDSADSYLRYTRLYPESDNAPELAVRAIEVYEKGNFPSLILPAKEAYVQNYGIDSQYWALRGLLRQEPLLPHLHQYLDELASYYHAEAQDLKEAASDQSQEYFLRAADYYRQFVSTFPLDDAVTNMTFLMAEAYFEGEALVEALAAYEQVAYDYADPEHAAEAGYSAIISLQLIIEKTPPVSETQDRVLRQWQEHKVRSALQFADTFPADSRAPRVLADAAEELFQQGVVKQALEVATRLTQWQPAPEPALQKTAWLVRAHSLFDLELFTAAEQSYRELLPLLAADDPDRPAVIERIAAAMYRQADQQLAAADKAGAVEQLLQIRDIAPASDIAISSQYDAANYLMELEQWQRAEQVLLDFRARYPQHTLTATLLPKLAVIYQETENWPKAAQTVSAMAKAEDDPEVQRQSLYLAAELYQKAGDTAQAIIHYRDYAHTYEQPFDLATEARFQLVTLYEQTNEPLKRNYWLEKLIDAHEQARDGSGSTDRAHYLAAFAARELANIDYYAFVAIKLDLPLKQNLQRKKAAMEKALQSYKQVLDYGVAEFATEANNRIGMVYAQLSEDLMNSERPADLDALAMEQYEILLEEQAYPFEEKAIAIHAANAERSWDGIYDDWVKRSFAVLAELLPARYGKQEARQEVSHGIY